MIDYDELSGETKTAIKEAFVDWVDQHSAPDQPYIELGGSEYTPREMLNKIQDEQTVGKIQIQTIAALAHHRPDSTVRDVVFEL